MPFLGFTGSGSSKGFGKNIAAPVLTWITGAGSIGGDYTGRVSSFTVAAVGATTYTLISGALATGHSLNTSTGVISGTASGPAQYITNTYNITIRATDGVAVSDRSFSYTITNRFVGFVCGTAGEDGVITITVPATPPGMRFIRRDFSSYGTPNGSCGAFTIGGCNSASSNGSNFALNQTTASVGANNTNFGDPCYGTAKRMYVQWTYGPF
jgi:hypothetical protein